MTTLTVEIEKAEDLAAVKDFFAERGLNYEVGEDPFEDFIYTDEIKRELDEDEEAYQRGEIIPISSEESKRRIAEILNKAKI